MDESIGKRVDESWKEQAQREKHSSDKASTSARVSVPSSEAPQPSDVPPQSPEVPEARFDLFVSGLAMEALIALGDMPHPTTRRQAANLPHAKYLIDLLGIMEQKTKGNLTVEEEGLLKDALYQLRMRYLAKSGHAAS